LYLWLKTTKIKFIVTEEEKRNILNLYKPLLKEETEDIENYSEDEYKEEFECKDCGGFLYYDSDYNGDFETIGGYSVEPLICSKCQQKYEVIDDGFKKKFNYREEY